MPVNKGALDSYGGGLFVGGGELLGFDGPELFTGSIESPTLKTGSFVLIDYFSGSPITLNVTAIPEPAHWAMMIGGLVAIGGVIRSRRLRV